jgi:hypothetical protein
MRLDDLARAVELQAELKLWRDAEARANPAVFKEAMLRVVDTAHGHQGQVADTQIKIKSEHILPFIKTQIGRVVAEMRALGVET